MIFNRQRANKDYWQYKTIAGHLIHERLEYYNQFYGFQYNRVSVKNQRSRWGSCSRQGNLNFNYRLVNLPSELADYIIVHELCHLKGSIIHRVFGDWSLKLCRII